jgi:hypothetical protein
MDVLLSIKAILFKNWILAAIKYLFLNKIWFS